MKTETMLADKAADKPAEGKEFFRPSEVCERYDGAITMRTLANWRSTRQGPPYMKVGGHVLYPFKDLIAWEKRNTFAAGLGGRQAP